jgi:glycosyltransferase involved in cell wall biosynthesis
MLDLHGKKRRDEMQGKYDALGKDSERSEIDGFPILTYQHRDDDRIAKIFLGPLVSVIIPTYKRMELLKRAVSSVLAQDYLPVEVIVVGDHCPDLVDVFEDSRVRVFNLPKNHGAGGAVPRNYGIVMSGGRWISYLDDDNYLKCNHLYSIFEEIQKKHLEESLDFCLTSMDVEGKPLIFKAPALGSADTSCIAHKKRLAADFGLWKNRDEAGYAHDWEFVSRWVNAGRMWIATENPTVVYNRKTSGQSEYLAQLVGINSEGS